MRTIAITLSLLAIASSGCTRRAEAALRNELSATVTDAVAAAEAGAEEEKVVRFDKTVHDFGDILSTDGPLSCTFTLTNISDKPIAILQVITSCGCTDVKWTKEPIQPGRTGTVKATYDNAAGPYPFDKTLTVYISGLRKPLILRLRGVAHEKQKSLPELYGAHRFGPLGMKDTEIKIGNMEQGGSRSETVYIANLGSTPASVSFEEVSEHLSLSVEPNPIPPGSTATLTLTARADRALWGKNWYSAFPLVNGKRQGTEPIRAWTFTKEDFDGLSDSERRAAAQPVFTESTWNFNQVEAGTVVTATFSFTNKGKDTFRCYKVDSDSPAVTISEVPDAAPGQTASFTATLDTGSLPKGEVLVLLTLTTNTPLRPMINLFIAGAIK